jgi:hypothetical protein
VASAGTRGIRLKLGQSGNFSSGTIKKPQRIYKKLIAKKNRTISVTYKTGAMRLNLKKM